MIAKLVIGPVSALPGETDSPHELHPHAIREWAERAHRGSATAWTVCTFSPTVIRAVIDVWDKDPLTFSRIVLRGDTHPFKDTPLLDVKNPEWLAHFAIEDLYMCGEFDAVLKGKTDGR